MEDDPVVQEIPVYLSTTLAKQLYLIQYPFYQPNRIFNKISIKPKNQKLSLEFLMKQGFNTKGKFKGVDKNEMLNSELINKALFISENKKPKSQNYAIGIFQDSELHITELKNIINMKVVHDHIDERDKHKEGRKNGDDDDEDEDNPSSVKVTFSRHLSENLKKKQEQSFYHHIKRTQEELWMQTNYIPLHDAQATLTQMKMFCPSPEALNALNEELKQYLQQFKTSMPLSQFNYSPNIYIDQEELYNITNMPLIDQIRIIMKCTQVISFKKLREMLSLEHNTTTILKYLQQIAVLVQGNWVVNSDLIYPKDAQNNNSEFMCKARDYVLLLFTEQLFIKRNILLSTFKLNVDYINEILTGIATCIPKNGWQLKQLPNQTFCERYPEIVERQQMLWDAKRKQLREFFETQNQLPQRQRRKSHRESIGSENEERNVGRGRKSLRDSSLSDNDNTTGLAKHKKSSSRSRKISETM